LIRQPAERSKRNHSLRADHDQAAKAMPDTRKTGMTAHSADPIFNQQVTAIYSGLDAIPEKGYHPVLWRNDRTQTAI
jgi:hypothetical protein